MSKHILAFDMKGPFGHYKKIFATTTALSYPIPVKTSLYGLFGAILGLDKANNAYLKHFEPGQCRVGIQLRAPVKMQRVNINLRPKFGSLTVSGKSNPDNRKPTLMEFVRYPHYRIYFQHEDEKIQERLGSLLRAGKSTYTPTFGLANLIAKLSWVGQVKGMDIIETEAIDINSVIPKSRLVKLNADKLYTGHNQLMEVGQYAVEMSTGREVGMRDDIIFDRRGATISAQVTSATRWELDSTTTANILLF